MTRKSPIRHHVTESKRVTPKTRVVVPVTDYNRGEGEAEKARKAEFLYKKDYDKPKTYKIKISYVEGGSDAFEVSADSYLEALEKSISKSEDIPVQYSLEVKGYVN